jgi:hypothetical protein
MKGRNKHMKNLVQFLLSILFLQSFMACGGNYNINIKGRDRTIVVPNTASMQPPYESNGQSPPRRYVVRMSDGKLDWEVELPESANGYELRIPFQGGQKGPLQHQGEGMTSGDKALVDHLRKNHPDYQNEKEGVFNSQDSQTPQTPQNPQNPQNPQTPQTPQIPQADAINPASIEKPISSTNSNIDPTQPAPSRQSYLVGLEQAKQLFNQGKFEMSLVVLGSLNDDYPNDIKILSMMGTLWLKMNRPELARTYWENVLRMDPQNRSIIEALKQINQTSNINRQESE